MTAVFHAAFLIVSWDLLSVYLHEWSNYENDTLIVLYEAGFTQLDRLICSYSFWFLPMSF